MTSCSQRRGRTPADDAPGGMPSVSRSRYNYKELRLPTRAGHYAALADQALEQSWLPAQ